MNSNSNKNVALDDKRWVNKNVALDDKRWVIEIRNFFEEENDDDEGNYVPVCIFHVPNVLKAIKPEAYSPQLIALGPYHHWREDLYKLEKYKLVSTKRVQARFKTLVLQKLVDKLMKMDAHVRACYHKFFDEDGETLAWLMTIDGIFLLDFLHRFTDKTHSALAFSPRLSRIFVGSGGKKLAYESILNDIFMLENQIPTIMLRKIMHVVHCTSVDLADDLLALILMDVCKQISPFQINEAYPHPKVIEHWHLLDLLYHLIIPEQEQTPQEISGVLEIKSMKRTSSSMSLEMETISRFWKLLSKINVGVIRKMSIVIMAPIKMISRISAVSNAVATLDEVLPSDHGNAEDTVDEKAPLVEEIMIPSVTELTDAGIEFCPTTGNITTIKFDATTRKFHLPVIHLEGVTEVVMRNLVAYEALAGQGPLVLARYTELMNGIIDTSEDAKLMDKAIVEANKYYDNTPKRKFRVLMTKYIYSSWRILLVIATILMIVLMGLQSFCTVFRCPKIFNTSGSSSDDDD